MPRTQTLLARFLLSASGAMLLLGLLHAISFGQVPAQPDRGTSHISSYALSDIESINLNNGNVNLSIPLASLPPIVGGKLGWTVRAVYNSKLWDVVKQEGADPLAGTHWVQDVVQMHNDGGWTIGANYQIAITNAADDFDYLLRP